MPRFSVIIPVYNRPEEIVELLDSLTLQSLKHEFEVLIVEDGSENPCKDDIECYFKELELKYIYQENGGPGSARNRGASDAKGEYLIFFDSDCIIPADYFKIVNAHLPEEGLDMFGGPDKEHPFFTPVQKAISYSMTSFITTGGIRGSQEKMDRFYPRSFNMGIRKDVFEKLNGFSDMRFGEDLDLSMRAIEKGYSVGLITDASVYHKRRTSFKSFFKQVYNSGVARINLSLLHENTLKPVHFLPALFTIGYPLLLIAGLFIHKIFLYLFWAFPVIIFTDSLMKMKSFKVAFLSIISSFIQLTGYGMGFIHAFWKRIILKKGTFHSFVKNFYD
ncbi:MAG: glycosyltransferase [Chlorobi bacterium]|nr:glycosyltransferase [Chlorobiota bacterium]